MIPLRQEETVSPLVIVITGTVNQDFFAVYGQCSADFTLWNRTQLCIELGLVECKISSSRSIGLGFADKFQISTQAITFCHINVIFLKIADKQMLSEMDIATVGSVGAILRFFL